MQEKLEKFLVPVLDKYEKMSLISMFLDVLDLIYLCKVRCGSSWIKLVQTESNFSKVNELERFET